MSIPIVNAWQLNERHYGALQGLDKQMTVDKYGKDKVQLAISYHLSYHKISDRTLFTDIFTICPLTSFVCILCLLECSRSEYTLYYPHTLAQPYTNPTLSPYPTLNHPHFTSPPGAHLATVVRCSSSTL